MKHGGTLIHNRRLPWSDVTSWNDNWLEQACDFSSFRRKSAFLRPKTSLLWITRIHRKNILPCGGEGCQPEQIWPLPSNDIQDMIQDTSLYKNWLSAFFKKCYHYYSVVIIMQPMLPSQQYAQASTRQLAKRWLRAFSAFFIVSQSHSCLKRWVFCGTEPFKWKNITV